MHKEADVGSGTILVMITAARKCRHVHSGATLLSAVAVTEITFFIMRVPYKASWREYIYDYAVVEVSGD